MNGRVRYGIIGFGRFAEKAICPAIQQSHNSEVTAIQNRSLTKAQEAAAACGVPHAFDSAADLVAHGDIDAVFIVSPNSLHCEETILAANAGKHVLCEKPMAMNVAECERMIAECKRHKVRLMIGHMVRMSPLVARMKERIRSGEVGRVVRVKADFVYDGRQSSRVWLLDRKVAGGGPVFDVGVHCLDTMRYLLDDEVVSVQREFMPEADSNRTESSAQLLLRFSKGPIGSIFCSYDSPIRESAIEIFGTEARLSATDFTVANTKAQLKIERGERGTSQSEDITVPNLYVEEVNHFSDCILNGTHPLLTAESALKNQHVLDDVMTN